jgi:hypothetical protein
MKNVIAGLVIMVFVSAGFSQTKGPSLSFEKQTHDFGTMKEEAGTATYNFKFVNTGGTPLIIQNVRATCGCTAPNWTREPIPPGGNGFVAATYNPAGRPGAFSKYLYVDSNSDQGSIRLTIKGEVTPKPRTIEDEYRYSMGALRLKANHLAFGSVNNTGKKDYRMEIINNSDKQINLGFQRVPDHIDIKFVPEVLKPNEKGAVVATYDAAKKNDWGMLIDRINVTVDGVYERSYSLVVSANVVEDFSSLSVSDLSKAPVAAVDNPEVSFGQMKQNEKFEHEFVLTNSGKSTLYIRKIKSSCGCTAARPDKLQIEPGDSVNIKTVFNSAGKRGNQNQSVTIITNDPKRSNLVLRIKGEVHVG